MPLSKSRYLPKDCCYCVNNFKGTEVEDETKCIFIIQLHSSCLLMTLWQTKYKFSNFFQMLIINEATSDLSLTITG